MQPNLIRYIWQKTKKQQAFILLVVLASMPPYFLSLDLPKLIVNGPIQGNGFDTPDATQRFFELTIKLPDLLGGATFNLFPGIDLERVNYLIALSLSFLLLVCINGLFKYYINTYKGRLGERTLRRIRFDLADRILRFPLPQFRKVRASEVATMIKEEVEPLGGFVGDAFVQPVFLGGQALTALTFIVIQNFWLGMLAVGGVAFQALIIPRLRRRLLVLAKQRQLTARELAGRVGEIVDGIGTIHINDTSNYERADLSSRLGRIFLIRFEYYQRKFFVKFLNNFLSQLTPFLFYAIGGYFAIRGSLDIGQLIAVIAAYKDLPSPIKELIDWDQTRLDVQVKWEQVIDQFDIDNMLDPALQAPTDKPVEPLQGEIDISNLSVIDDSGAKLIEHATYRGDIHSRIGIVGSVNSGAETFAEVLARLVPATGGRMKVAGHNLEELPQAVTGRRIGYAGADSYLAQASVRDTLLYGLKHVPLRPATATPANKALRMLALSETRASGNSELDIEADWVDYEAAGASGPHDIAQVILGVLRIVNLHGDIYDLGLRGSIDPTVRGDLAERILQGRAAFRDRLATSQLGNYVEPFDLERYSLQATVAENLLFGTAAGPQFAEANLANNAYLRSVLDNAGLTQTLYEIGKEIAATAIELFADLSPDNPFFEQLSFMTPEEIPVYQAVLARVQTLPIDKVKPHDLEQMLRLPFAYIEPRHRMGLLTEHLKQALLGARAAFRENLPEELRDAIAFYDPEAYNAAASIQDNVLLGRVSYGVADAHEKVRSAIHDVLDEVGLKHDIREVGLQFNIGSSGKRLSAVQRQKLTLARALIKRPDLLIVNRALSALDPAGQNVILERILEASRGDRPFGVIWVLSNPAHADRFDAVLVFKDGALVDYGPPQQLREQSSHFKRLVA